MDDLVQRMRQHLSFHGGANLDSVTQQLMSLARRRIEELEAENAKLRRDLEFASSVDRREDG